MPIAPVFSSSIWKAPGTILGFGLPVAFLVYSVLLPQLEFKLGRTVDLGRAQPSTRSNQSAPLPPSPSPLLPRFPPDNLTLSSIPETPLEQREAAKAIDTPKLAPTPPKREKQLSRAGSGCTLSPVVVAGCGHSGTSILQMLLSSHPDAFGVSSDTSFESGELVTDNVDKISRAAEKITAQCTGAGKRFWVEKTPSNVHHLGSILKAIPQAKIVVIYRNGYDVAKSLQRRSQRKSIASGIERWNNANSDALKFLGNPRVHFIQYESLTARPHMELHTLCTFLQISHEPAAMLSLSAVNKMMPPTKNKPRQANVKLRLKQMQNPLRKSSSYHLTGEEEKIVGRLGNATLTLFGYTYEHGAMQNIQVSVDHKAMESIQVSVDDKVVKEKTVGDKVVNFESGNNTSSSEFLGGNIKQWISKMSRSLGFDVGSIDKAGTGLGVYPKTREQVISQIRRSIVSKEYLVEDHHRFYGAPWYQGREAFNFLVSKAGLQAGNTVLEVGCGSMRIGVWMTAFLDVGKYHCIEPDRKSLQHGIAYEVPLHGLIGKNPRFASNAQFDLSTFGDTVFDFVLMHAVDIHFSPKLSNSCFLQLLKRVRPGGRVLLSHTDPHFLRLPATENRANSAGFRKTRTFWEECEMYQCRGACFDDPKCASFDGYKWVEFTRVKSSTEL